MPLISRESICILDGGLKARPCPGAKRFEIHGRTYDDYFSSDLSVCSKAERKFRTLKISDIDIM